MASRILTALFVMRMLRNCSADSERRRHCVSTPADMSAEPGVQLIMARSGRGASWVPPPPARRPRWMCTAAGGGEPGGPRWRPPGPPGRTPPGARRPARTPPAPLLVPFSGHSGLTSIDRLHAIRAVVAMAEPESSAATNAQGFVSRRSCAPCSLGGLKATTAEGYQGWRLPSV